MPLPVSEKIKNNNPFLEMIYQSVPGGFTGHPRCALQPTFPDDSPNYGSDTCIQSEGLIPTGNFVGSHFEFQNFTPRMPLPCRECSILKSINGPPTKASTPNL